jgi:hypothetical protein
VNDKPVLTEEQLARIDATLKRIRGGLKKIEIAPGEEPAHLFTPETDHGH